MLEVFFYKLFICFLNFCRREQNTRFTNYTTCCEYARHCARCWEQLGIKFVFLKLKKKNGFIFPEEMTKHKELLFITTHAKQCHSLLFPQAHMLPLLCLKANRGNRAEASQALKEYLCWVFEIIKTSS